MNASSAPTLAQCIALVEATYGLDVASAKSLGSHEDLNVLITDAKGARWVAKFAHPSAPVGRCEAQVAALASLGREGEQGEGRIGIPSVLPAQDGALVHVASLDGERPCWLVEYMDGATVTDRAVPPAGFAEDLGRCVAQVLEDLAPLDRDAFTADNPWDMRNADAMINAALPVMDADESLRVGAAYATAKARLAGLERALPVQVIHGDLTSDNVLVDSTDRLCAVIDFGDIGTGWRVAELAVAMTSVLHHDGDGRGLALDVMRGFASRATLADAEIASLWPLVVLRAAVLVSSAALVAAEDPGNDYARARRPLERRMLERALGWDLDEAELLLRHAGGAVPAQTEAVAPMFEAPLVSWLSLAVDSPVHDAGAFLDEASAGLALVAAAKAEGEAGHGGFAATVPFEHRLMPAALGQDAPRSFALGIEVRAPEGAVVSSPGAGTVSVTESGDLVVALDHGGSVIVGGLDHAIAAGERVEAGERIGTVGAEALWLQRCTSATAMPPRFAHAGNEDAWKALCPDPAVLLGHAAPASAPDPEGTELKALREAHVADAQEFYYARPPRIERGWRHHLIDATGRGYLDMVNNVAILGHGDPRIAAAVNSQLLRLNTNSRFHYGAIAEFSARLAAKAPEGLDYVFLVNSGSEAVDLALRIVKAATARGEVLALTEAYHGWTVGADAVSTSLGDNPNALETRPAWVHLLDAPNTYRGRHRGDEAWRYSREAVDRIAQLTASGVELAGMISEPIFGNGGGVLLPDGYLEAVWGAVRAAGGLVISDEVQVSYGRLGKHFWGFEQQGVVPDVIAVAKAMGNGHPLGAVITTREIAKAFGAEGSFFSSAGGSPVSCVVGSTVLDIVEGDGLQERAERIGTMLRDGLIALGERFPALGAVHGMGLYLGVEVVSGGPDEPDARAAREICEALLGHGVIVQTTGDHKNVLKIKPPLTLDEEGVERFMAALESVLVLRESRAAL